MLWPQISMIITADVQPLTNTHITLQVKKILPLLSFVTSCKKTTTKASAHLFPWTSNIQPKPWSTAQLFSSYLFGDPSHKWDPRESQKMSLFYLVGAPAGKIYSPVMQMKIYIPNSMSQVKSNKATLQERDI